MPCPAWARSSLRKDIYERRRQSHSSFRKGQARPRADHLRPHGHHHRFADRADLVPLCRLLQARGLSALLLGRQHAAVGGSRAVSVRQRRQPDHQAHVVFHPRGAAGVRLDPVRLHQDRPRPPADDPTLQRHPVADGALHPLGKRVFQGGITGGAPKPCLLPEFLRLPLLSKHTGAILPPRRRCVRGHVRRATKGRALHLPRVFHRQGGLHVGPHP